MNQYQKIKLLGSGTYGKCYLVTKVDSQQSFVMKQIDISDMNQQEKEIAIREAKILEILDHPHIIKIQQCFISDSGENFNIVMEYADGGDLASKIQEMKKSMHSQQQIINWFTQICIALKRVHEKKIIHRDLKSHNVFLMKDGTVKLGDFGIARKLNQTLQKIKTVVGTPYYMPPEIFDNKQYSFKADIWSLGVILYQLYCHKPPFDANSLGAIALKVMNGTYAPITHPINKQMKKLINDMLQVNPNRRPSLSKILKTPILQQRIKFYSQKIFRAQNPLQQINTKQNMTQMQSDINTEILPKEQEYKNYNKKLILISENSEVDETELFNQIKTPHYKNSNQSIHFKENGSNIKQSKPNIIEHKKPQLRRRQISQPNLTPKGNAKWQLSKKMKSNNSLAQLQKKKSQKVQCMKKKNNKNKLILDEIKQIHEDVVEMKNKIYFNQGFSSQSGEVSSSQSKLCNETITETLTYLLISQIGEQKFNQQYKIFRQGNGFSEKINGNHRGLLSLLYSLQN